MPRKVLFAISAAVVTAVVALGTISANARLHEGCVHLPGQECPDLSGGGGGGGGGGGVTVPDAPELPGGGGGGGGLEVPDLPGGGGGGGEILPEEPIIPDEEEPPPTGGGGGGDTGGGGGGRGGGSRDGGGDGGREPERNNEPRSGNQIAENPQPPMRNSDGTPTLTNPGLTVADFGSAPVGVPNFVINQFTIPPFLLPIYQACGTQYGIPWEVLASINRIETAFGTNLNVSYAGAEGWMQFIPSTWDAYGVDANNDGEKDPYNPVDAICAAARYLNAAGGEENLREAIFAYNHADWYVDEVLLYARQYGKLPDDLVGSLTGLTEGARFPVAADARYADDISERQAARDAKSGEGEGNVSETVTSSPTRRGINIYSREGAPVIAVNDGVIEEIGRSKKLGNYIVLKDNYGNRFTYAELGSISEAYPVPKEPKKSKAPKPGHAEAPDEPASKLSKQNAGSGGAAKGGKSSMGDGQNGGKANDGGSKGSRSGGEDARSVNAAAPGTANTAEPETANTEDSRPRLYAFPDRQGQEDMGSQEKAHGLDVVRADALAVYERLNKGGVLRYKPNKMTLAQLKEGSKVVAGTVLGRIGDDGELAPHVNFSIRPAGRGAPRIDPKPILDGWKLLEATAIYRAAGKDPFADSNANAGQVLLMSKEQLIPRVLGDNKIEIYECGRQDIQAGLIDRRVLALLAYLSSSGFRLGVTSLQCGHSVLTASGNVSNHSTGSAVDIATLNGLPVLGNQGPGSITETVLNKILDLQGVMVPDELISLMDLGGPSFSLSDHADHIHVGYSGGTAAPDGSKVPVSETQVLKPRQWQKLIGRIGEIENPEVRTSPSAAATPAKKGEGKKDHQASDAHRGE